MIRSYHGRNVAFASKNREMVNHANWTISVLLHQNPQTLLQNKPRHKSDLRNVARIFPRIPMDILSVDLVPVKLFLMATKVDSDNLQKTEDLCCILCHLRWLEFVQS